MKKDRPYYEEASKLLEAYTYDVEINFENRDMYKDSLKAVEKALSLADVSGSALLGKAKQMQKENQYLIDNATVNADKEHKEAIGIGIDRIVRLIERHYR